MLWAYTSQDVLTMEYAPGTKINRAAELDKLGVNRKLLAKRAVESYLQQLLTFGFFHAGESFLKSSREQKARPETSFCISHNLAWWSVAASCVLYPCQGEACANGLTCCHTPASFWEGGSWETSWRMIVWVM